MNQIIIKNLKIFAYHGVHDFEKKNGQDFFIDAVLDLPEMPGFESDEISQVISYSAVVRAIKKVMTEKSYDLIEKAAVEIISEIFSSFSEVESVDITVKKPHAPIKEEFEYVAVRFKRMRGEK